MILLGVAMCECLPIVKTKKSVKSFANFQLSPVLSIDFVVNLLSPHNAHPWERELHAHLLLLPLLGMVLDGQVFVCLVAVLRLELKLEIF